MDKDKLFEQNLDKEMESWEFDRPAFVDEEENSLEHILKTSKNVEEATERLGYDPTLYILDLKATLEEKNLKSKLIVIRDRSAHNPDMKRQYKKFLKEYQKADPVKREGMKFKYIPSKKAVSKYPKKKVKYPKCYGKKDVFGHFKCNACSFRVICEKNIGE